MLRCVEGIFTAALRGATSNEQLSVGCHPRLIYDAAAAAKTVSVFIKARSGSPKAILVKSFGHSLRSSMLTVRPSFEAPAAICQQRV
jgi:hypothetical protein